MGLDYFLEEKTMKKTEQKLTEPPKSLGRWLMKSTRQTQKELQEAYQNNPRIKQIFEELADKSKSESMNANGAYVFTKYKQNK